jgi:hypothetical protein
MAGGQFQLVGGFWAAQTATCTCPGDMNGDGTRNGMDVQQFVGCILGSGTCGCADLNGAGGVDVNDVQIFVQDLLTAQDCP